MLRIIAGCPAGVIGIEAQGTVTLDDYERTIRPILDSAHRQGKRIRFLYQFGPHFDALTLGAAWDDFRLGLGYLLVFERCAVVSDVSWVCMGAGLMTHFMPCPVRTFKSMEMSQAIEWLSAPQQESTLRVDLIAEKGVLVIEPKGPLAVEDFERLATIVDSWIEEHHHLHGLVLHVLGFPGWKNFSAFLRHVEFVRGHHKNIERVAITGDGLAIEILPRIGAHFVSPEVMHFAYSKLDDAIFWAGAAK